MSIDATDSTPWVFRLWVVLISSADIKRQWTAYKRHERPDSSLARDQYRQAHQKYESVRRDTNLLGFCKGLEITDQSFRKVLIWRDLAAVIIVSTRKIRVHACSEHYFKSCFQLASYAGAFLSFKFACKLYRTINQLKTSHIINEQFKMHQWLWSILLDSKKWYRLSQKYCWGEQK